MAAETNIKSVSITALDASPLGAVSAGQGAPGYPRIVDDVVAVNATAIQSAGSYYRLVRLPWNALINRLEIAFSTVLDTNASNTLAFDIGVAFSDSTVDGTAPHQLGTIPTTANNGTTTTFGAYSAPNKLFGGLTASVIGRTTPYMSGNLLFNGQGANYPMASIASFPLWQLFGFVDGRGYPMCPGGMADIYMYATTGAATGVAGNIYCAVGYDL